MECLTFQMVWTLCRTVYIVPQNGMSNAFHMDTNLMGTACFQLAFNIGEIGEALAHVVMGDG